MLNFLLVLCQFAMAYGGSCRKTTGKRKKALCQITSFSDSQKIAFCSAELALFSYEFGERKTVLAYDKDLKIRWRTFCSVLQYTTTNNISKMFH